MFPAVHAYVAREAAYSDDSLLIVGSVLPDVAITRIVNWNETHTKGVEFRDYVLGVNPSYRRLADGVIMHGRIPRGVDHFSDVEYDGGLGYAFQKSRTLVNKVAISCGLSTENTIAAAHTFVEMALDYWLTRSHPEISDLLKDSLTVVDRDQISKHFAGFYLKDFAETKRAVNEYFNVLLSGEITNREGLVALGAWILRKAFSVDIDTTSAIDVLDKAINITKPTYQEFLGRAVNLVCQLKFE